MAFLQGLAHGLRDARPAILALMALHTRQHSSRVLAIGVCGQNQARAALQACHVVEPTGGLLFR